MPALAAALPPENTELPAISPHEPWENIEAVASKGAWTNSPMYYRYKWLRCNLTGGACEKAKITYAENRHFVEAADVGHTLKVEVTATNSSGSATATSELAVVEAPGVVTLYGKPEHTPNSFVAGPDGNVWFTTADDHIGKISPAGTVTNVATLVAGSYPANIAAGLEGEQALWFATFGGEKAHLKKITTAGVVSEVAISGEPRHIAAQGSSYMWVTEPSQEEVAQISPTGTVTQRHTAPTGVGPGEIAYAKQENVMWAAAGKQLIRLKATGEVAEFSDPGAGEPRSFVKGYDGYAWFIDGETNNPTIADVKGAGVIGAYKPPVGISPSQLAGGADHRIWFNDAPLSYFGSMTTSGTFTTYWHEMAPPVLFAATPDGHVWFVTSEGTIGKFTV
jgi:streptogramin lyase